MYKTIDHYSDKDEVLVCHDEKGVYHFIEVTKGHYTSTGLPIMEIFPDAETALEKYLPEINKYNEDKQVQYDAKGKDIYVDPNEISVDASATNDVAIETNKTDVTLK